MSQACAQNGLLTSAISTPAPRRCEASKTVAGARRGMAMDSLSKPILAIHRASDKLLCYRVSNIYLRGCQLELPCAHIKAFWILLGCRTSGKLRWNNFEDSLMMVGVWQGLGLDSLPETRVRYLMGNPWVIGIASWLFIRVIRYSCTHTHRKCWHADACACVNVTAGFQKAQLASFIVELWCPCRVVSFNRCPLVQKMVMGPARSLRLMVARLLGP